MEQDIVTFWNQLQSGQLAELPSHIYILIALLTLFEGPLTTLTSAAAASAGLLDPALVFLSASTGNLVGDVLWHSLGRAGKLDWFLRRGRGIRIKAEQLEWFTRNIQNHAPKIIFLTKVSSSFIIPSLVSTGLAQLSWRRWFPALLLGEILWTGTLITLGYFAVQAIPEVASGLKFLPIFGILLVSLFILIRIARRAIR